MSISVKRDKWCRHRTAFDREKFPVCKVGVNYHEFREVKPGLTWMQSMPCLGESAEAIARCPQYSGYTDEEIAQHERDAEDSMKRIGEALKAIREHTKGERGLQGQIPCPTCSKPLHFSVARYNGHVHAKCETQGCVSFMQ